MIRCLLVRHGQTDWNVAKRLQGHTDIPLNEQGRAQAYDVAKALADTPIDLVLSSDLSRASQTAIAIADRNCAQPRILTTPKLREMDVGQLAGYTYDEIQAMPQADLWMSWRTPTDDPELWHLKWPGGESRADLSQRAMDAITSCIATHQPQTLLVAAHGGTLKHLTHAMFPAHDMGRVPNCAVLDTRYRPEHDTWHYKGLFFEGVDV